MKHGVEWSHCHNRVRVNQPCVSKIVTCLIFYNFKKLELIVKTFGTFYAKGPNL